MHFRNTVPSWFTPLRIFLVFVGIKQNFQSHARYPVFLFSTKLHFLSVFVSIICDREYGGPQVFNICIEYALSAVLAICPPGISRKWPFDCRVAGNGDTVHVHNKYHRAIHSCTANAASHPHVAPITITITCYAVIFAFLYGQIRAVFTQSLQKFYL